jgi:chromosomal replication initiator protein
MSTGFAPLPTLTNRFCFMTNLENEPKWKDVLNLIQGRVSADSFNRWFSSLECQKVSDKELEIRVPNPIHQFFLESNYLPMMQAAVAEVFPGGRNIRFICHDSGEDDSTLTPISPEPEPAAVRNLKAEERRGSVMNPRNTFETFVVGTNNQFAYAACHAVATNPARIYNPLFIYGGSGLGKTHLLQAIGHYVLDTRKTAKIAYLTSEQFTNEFIDAIQHGTLIKFRKKYRSVDVLMIDDIQFLQGKERSQEEFFHTFNALHDGHKQIVLSSDRAACEIEKLEQRLVSRFEWGLTAELQPPDMETRIAILKSKAAGLNMRLPDWVLEYLADRIRTNVRRLEGALTRVASYHSLSGREITRETIENLLRDIFQEQARKAVTIDQIQRKVAERFDVRLADMTSKRRPAHIAFPRQVAMYLSRELTGSSLADIGEAFGGKDHGTVIHANKLVRKRMQEDAETRHLIEGIIAELQR